MTELKLSEIKGLVSEDSIIENWLSCYLRRQGYASSSPTHKTTFFKQHKKLARETFEMLSTKNLLDYVEAVVCDMCGGDGAETCNNPDHGFISAVGGEIGRLGCPCCGNDPSHKVINGGKCEECHGTGAVIKVKEGK